MSGKDPESRDEERAFGCRDSGHDGRSIFWLTLPITDVLPIWVDKMIEEHLKLLQRMSLLPAHLPWACLALYKDSFLCQHQVAGYIHICLPFSSQIPSVLHVFKVEKQKSYLATNLCHCLLLVLSLASLGVKMSYLKDNLSDEIEFYLRSLAY